MSINSDEQSQKSNGLREWLGILIAVIPAAGYISAFIFEFAYCNHFSIPAAFIVLNWTNILFAIGITLAAVFTVFYILMFPWILKRISIQKKLGPIEIRLITAACLFFLVMLLTSRYPLIRPYSQLIYDFWLLLVLLDFLGPCMTQRDINGYRHKLIAQDEKMSQDISTSMKFTNKNMVIFFMSVFIIPGMAYLEGDKFATEKIEFLIPSSNPGYAVLSIYDDNMICAPYTCENLTKNEFIIVNLKQTDNTTFVLQKMGPLKSQ